jgi:hypothetical protein
MVTKSFAVHVPQRRRPPGNGVLVHVFADATILRTFESNCTNIQLSNVSRSTVGYKSTSSRLSVAMPTTSGSD